MKILFASLVVLMSACGVGHVASRGGRLASSEGDDRIVAGVKGCYEVTGVAVSESALPNETAVTQVLSASKLCLEDTLHDGAVSRSGRVVVTAQNSAGVLVGGAWGFDVAAAQPRCPGCYALDGFDGFISWDGERHILDKTAPIVAWLKISSLETTYKFSLGQKSE